MAGTKRVLGSIIPFWLRVELLRLRRAVVNLRDSSRLARERGDVSSFPFVLAEYSSPLERIKGAIPAHLQEGKEKNVAIAAKRIDKLVVGPGELFSYHRMVGRPTRLRGFKYGLELREGEESAGIGGGCCQVSNMIYWLSVNAGMKITERHRHGLDLFPDHLRTVPFGCGATVFYNYADLRFENPLPIPILISIYIEDRMLVGRMLTTSNPGYRITIEERDHRFFEENGIRMRENRLFRRITDSDGRLLREELLAHNRCRVAY